MKTMFLFCLAFAVIVARQGWSQNSCDKVYATPDKIAKYKQGTVSLLTYLQRELAPVIGDCVRRDEEVIASLYIVLTIDDKGKVIDADFTRPTLTATCKAALKKKLSAMKGWSPGQVAGHNVCSKFKWPIGCLQWE